MSNDYVELEDLRFGWRNVTDTSQPVKEYYFSSAWLVHFDPLKSDRTLIFIDINEQVHTYFGVDFCYYTEVFEEDDESAVVLSSDDEDDTVIFVDFKREDD